MLPIYFKMIFSFLFFLFTGCDCWNPLCIHHPTTVVSFSTRLWPFLCDSSIGTNLHYWNPINHVRLLPSRRQVEHGTPRYHSPCRRWGRHFCWIMAQLPVRTCSRESTHTLCNPSTNLHSHWSQFYSTSSGCTSYAANRRATPSDCPTRHKPHAQDGLTRPQNKKDANIWTSR